MTENLDNALPVGTHLKHYVIEKLLGQGGFSLVYLARDESLARPVAIKEYLPEQLAKRTKDNTVSPYTQSQPTFNEWRTNFIKEARRIAQPQLSHPAIVTVLEVFEDNNTAYMVMPYYAGETLKHFQERTHKCWNEAELKTFLEPLLNALELLHQQNILHRDIAPDNIFLKDNCQPMLIDFGAARQIKNKHTQSQNLLHKHGYSPIEHYSVRGKSQAGSWTDIYSLAAVVYELATGKKVHPVLDRVNDDQMPSLKACHPVGLSANFITSIDFALAIKGKDRPQSISAWRDCMKMGKQATSNTKLTPVRFNFKNYQRPLIILGIGLLIGVLAYRLFPDYQTWQKERDRLAAIELAQAEAEKKRLEAIQLEERKKIQEEENNTRLAAMQLAQAETEKTRLAAIQLAQAETEAEAAQQTKAEAAAEKTRREVIKQAKTRLNGKDETLWQAAVIYLESHEPLDGEAMFLLGASYTFPNGINGIKHDEKLACQWFKKAADAGNKQGKHYAELPPCTNYKS